MGAKKLIFKDIMNAVRKKLGESGRVVIPASFRDDLNLTVGDDVVLHMQDDVIYIITPKQALRKLQAKVRNYINSAGQNISLVDELIAARRLEVDQ